MEILRIYDYLELARRRLFDWVRPLDPGQYGREFPIGHRTLGRTLTHIMTSEWYYVERLEGRAVPPYDTWPVRAEAPPPFPALEAAWTAQAERTRAALGAPRDWHAPLEYRVLGDDGRPAIVTASASDIVTQLLLHEVHHRAQAMGMLRGLGAAIEDLDFNALMYRRRPAPDQGAPGT